MNLTTANVTPNPRWLGLRLATGTLTVIPVGKLPAITTPVARRAMLLAPIAALPLGALTVLVLTFARWVQAPPLVAGFVVVGALAGATRAMHVDGLADTVDGFGAGWSRVRALEVMKRGDVGPMGVSAVVVTAGVQAACFAALTDAAWVAGAVVVVSRVACTVLAHRHWRAARPDGMGAVMLGTVTTAGVVMAGALSALVLAAACAWTWSPEPLSAWRAGLLPAATAVVDAGGALVWLARRATRILGGLTGDIMGAGIEVALTVMLVVLTWGVWR